MHDDFLLPPEDLIALAAAILVASGTAPEHAEVVARSLVEANVAGHDSHGVLRLMSYVEFVQRGDVQPSAEPAVAFERGAIARVDGRRGWGQLAAQLATATAVRLARSHGVGVVVVDRCGHVGRVGEYVETIAAAGFVGHALCNAEPAVAAPGTGVRALGTNPVAWAVPRGEGEPVLVDFATAELAEGKLRVAVSRGEQLKVPAVVDAQGRPSHDPATFYDGGALVPFGGHKGYALSVVAELLGRGFAAGAEDDGHDTPYSLFILGSRPRRDRHRRGLPRGRRRLVRRRARTRRGERSAGDPAGRPRGAGARRPARERRARAARDLERPARTARRSRRRADPRGGLMSTLADLNFRGSTVIITGAAGGIGTAMAQGFAARGASLALLDLNEDGVEALAQELRANGAKVLARRCDTSSEADVVAAVDATEGELGGPHVLVNNAALGSHTRPEELTLEEWNAVIAVSLTGYFLFARECGRRMLAAGSGAIVNIASIGGVSAIGRGNFAYDVSKAGVIALTRELGVEWATRGVRVNAVAPCQVLTPGLRALLADEQFETDALMQRFLGGIPIGRLASPDDVVGAVLFLASSSAAMTTGATLPVDGGNLALNAGGSTTW